MQRPRAWHDLCGRLISAASQRGESRPMPGFGHPWFLTLLLLVLPLVWWWSRRRRRALRYPADILLAGLPAGRSQVALWGEWLGRGLGLALLIVALAGPRWPDLHSRAPAEGIAIEMVVDV